MFKNLALKLFTLVSTSLKLFKGRGQGKNMKSIENKSAIFLSNILNHISTNISHVATRDYTLVIPIANV